ncbi:hypothetical protein FKW77_003572 [Venturia effusa]|uniref:Uncharacterized protein n=1 Tax=Venturia effusa TaxID=50376 RepID=A0A517KW12_9PEZI|nr:hypothetical protein FKW77_003572 [Venturia effusa]
MVVIADNKQAGTSVNLVIFYAEELCLDNPLSHLLLSTSPMTNCEQHYDIISGVQISTSDRSGKTMASFHADLNSSSPPVTFLSLPRELRQMIILIAVFEAPRRCWGLGHFFMAQDLRATHPDIRADVDWAWHYLTTNKQEQ